MSFGEWVFRIKPCIVLLQCSGLLLLLYDFRHFSSRHIRHMVFLSNFCHISGKFCSSSQHSLGRLALPVCSLCISLIFHNNLLQDVWDLDQKQLLVSVSMFPLMIDDWVYIIWTSYFVYWLWLRSIKTTAPDTMVFFLLTGVMFGRIARLWVNVQFFFLILVRTKSGPTQDDTKTKPEV